MSPPALPAATLAALEAAVGHALATRDESALRIVGYGEITTVLGCRAPDGACYACKRLPPFAGAAAVAAYRACFDEYLAALARSGLRVVDSAVQVVASGDGAPLIAWCVQPELPPECIGPRVLAACDAARAVRYVGAILERVRACVGPQVGFDAQLSNWAFVGAGRPDDILYLDVTTPMLRDEAGAERLDTELFLASLPWALRGAVRRFLLRSILDTFYDPRGVTLDFLGNLLKEGFAQLLPALIAHANAVGGPAATPPFREAEIRRYYRGDARTWALLQRLRRADRVWQRHVRRRVYPFLLPGPIDRRR